MRSAALLLLALAGCNTQMDPCAALAGKTCLAVRARGPMKIDQLELQGVIGVELAAPARTPPVAAGAFELPAVTAVDLGNFEGAFVIRVRGLREGVELGAGLAAGDLMRGQHRTVDVDLRAGEDAAILDGSSEDLSRPDAAISDLASSADAAGDLGTTTAEWRRMRNDLVAHLYGIWGPAANNLFVVGEKASDGAGVVLRGSDDNWTAEAHGVWRLNSVWGTANSNVYVASEQGTIWQFDGVNWTLSNSVGGAVRAIYGIDATTVFAVGTQLIAKLNVPNSNSWSQVFANESGWTNYFYGVWLASADPVFAAGYRLMLPSSGMGMVRASTGGNWPLVQTPDERLNAIWGSSPDDVYAVGAVGRILHYSGTTWSSETLPAVPDLYGVWGSGPDDVYAVGDSGYVFHRGADKTWRTEPTPAFGRLRAVFGIAGAVYAVGDNGVILRKP